MDKKIFILALTAIFLVPSLVMAQQYSAFAPQQTEYVEWKFTTPNNNQIAFLPAECPVRYKVTYKFDAVTQTDITFINPTKLRDLYRAGTPPSAKPVQMQARGPIKIAFEFGVPQPVEAREDKVVLPVFLTVQDVGTGLYPRIPADALSLSWDKNDFEAVSCDKFQAKEGKLMNKDPIEMVKKKSPQIRCSFKFKSGSASSISDTKTYYLTARLNGIYTLDRLQRVGVKPTAEK